MLFQLAACAEMLYPELDFVDRVRRLDEQGFAVEIWDWSTKDIPALAATGAQFSSMTGYLRGDLITDHGAKELVATARQSLEVAGRLGVPRLNLHGTGLDAQGQAVAPRECVSGAEWFHARDTLADLAQLAVAAGRVFTLENLNTAVDHPGVPFAKACETRALVEAVNSPGLRMNLDLYHAQIGEGNLVRLVGDSLPWVGEIQVADVPGRCEPGTGEVHWERIAQELSALGYTGVVAMEAFASETSDAALEAFRSAFS